MCGLFKNQMGPADAANCTGWRRAKGRNWGQPYSVPLTSIESHIRPGVASCVDKSFYLSLKRTSATGKTDIDSRRIPAFWSFKIACGYWANHGADVVMVIPMKIMRPQSFSRMIRTLIQIGRRRKKHSAQRGKRGSPTRTCRPGTPWRSSVSRRGTSSPSVCAPSTLHAMLGDTFGQSPTAPYSPCLLSV